MQVIRLQTGQLKDVVGVVGLPSLTIEFVSECLDPADKPEPDEFFYCISRCIFRAAAAGCDGLHGWPALILRSSAGNEIAVNR